jgi:DNA-binding GntR family transcriptional regulator
MERTPLINQLASQIAAHIDQNNLRQGERLLERKLAEQFRVSRSPVRSALRLLQEHGVVEPCDRGGFAVGTSDLAVLADLEGISSEDELLYFQIADDRVAGTLPDKITENELLRRYDLTRARLTRILRRITNEGWIERLPGHGWEFLPVLTSLQAYEDSYRFRLLIEPAAILEPRFVLNRSALERCRLQQQWLVNGGIWKISDAKLFEFNSGMHEAIISCSQNSFFIDALKRIDRVRRLMEYRQKLDRESALGRCREHIQLLDLLLAEKRSEASQFLGRHLLELSSVKTTERDTGKEE